MCSRVLENKDITNEYLIKYFKGLAFDKVVNVRVTLAKVLSDAVIKKSNIYYNI
jgi:hypothetical protein